MSEAQILNRFFAGEAFDAYRYFGPQFTEYGVSFRVYAPRATRVCIIGEFNGWQECEMIQVDPRGIWATCVEQAAPGQMYKYRIFAHGLDGPRDRCDPFARQAQLRPETASVVPAHTRYSFRDKAWRERRCGNHYDTAMHIYEVHAGSWRRHEDGSVLTYREMAQPLIEYCRLHFYTHIEFLPLTEYPFDGSWGYQPGGYFAVTARYGTPEDFCWLVDQCHRAGLGVIMDFVPIHFIPDEYALARFDGAPLYEYDDDTGLRMSEWGSCNFDFGRAATRSFLQSAADFWLTVCHVDGLRFDAVRNAIYVQGDQARGENADGLAFLRAINAGLKKRHPDCLLIAEDSTSYLKVTAPTQYGGLGFDYKWNMGWMHDTLSFFSRPPAKRRDEYHQLTFSMSYFYNDLFVLALSHDEVVHGKKTILDKMWGDDAQKFAGCRALLVYFYTHPGKKLSFMGNEFGMRREWSEARQLDWQLLGEPMHQGLECCQTGLAGIYRNSPALHCSEYDAACFRWVEANDHTHCVYAYEREAGGDRLLVVLNLSDRPLPQYKLHFSKDVRLREILNSDHSHYGGSGMLNDGTLYTEPNGTVRLALAALSGCVFRVEAL